MTGTVPPNRAHLEYLLSSLTSKTNFLRDGLQYEKRCDSLLAVNIN